MTPTIILSLVMVLIARSEQSVQERGPRETRSYRPFVSGECVKGNGLGYRGKVSVTKRGNVCLNWNRVIDVYSSSFYETGVGPHNYCRNPDNSRSPWCWVRTKRNRWVPQYCDIPSCATLKPTTTTTTRTTTATTTTSIPTTPAVADRDTEFTCGERKEVGRRFKIVGGSQTPVSSHPWIASIFHNRFFCAGSLIAPCWVLTAAHCFKDSQRLKMHKLRVFLGKNAVNETDLAQEQRFTVKQIIRHEGFRETGSDKDHDHDIALLKIEGAHGECAVRTETARTVCLPPAYTKLPPGSFCTIAGYGRGHFGGKDTNYLMEGQVRLRAQATCEKEAPVGSMVTENMFCAASPDWETDACQSDSGGPLVCEADGRMFLFGIISYGDECAKKGKPGFYTRVTNYNKWIARQTGLRSYTLGSMYPQK